MKTKQSTIFTYFCISFFIFTVFGCAGKYFHKNKITVNSIGMHFTYINSGDYYMGSPYEEKGRNSDENQRKVTIKNGFYMQTTEVTLGQWEALMGKNKSIMFKHYKKDHPIVLVRMPTIQEFIKRLNKSENTNKYRLPTEQEWEYACRAGTTDAYHFGNDPKKLKNYAWYSENSKGDIQRVGQKKPNQLGLYDMHGNVYEYCSDCTRYHSSTTLVDESTNPERCSCHAVKGGGAGSDPEDLRSANKHCIYRPAASLHAGFRLVKDE